MRSVLLPMMLLLLVGTNFQHSLTDLHWWKLIIHHSSSLHHQYALHSCLHTTELFNAIWSWPGSKSRKTTWLVTIYTSVTSPLSNFLFAHSFAASEQKSTMCHFSHEIGLGLALSRLILVNTGLVNTVNDWHCRYAQAYSPREPEPVERAAIRYLHQGNGPALSSCWWQCSQGKANRRPKDKDERYRMKTHGWEISFSLVWSCWAQG